MEAVLSVRGLTRRFVGHSALTGVSLCLARGEVLGLLGANGAGKTTCLRILSGNLAPSAGEVRVLGLDLARAPLSAKRHIGYLPERPPLYTDMRIGEYLSWCARLHRVPPEQAGGAVLLAMDRCGLDGAERRPLAALSKGWRQRVGLAQAIVHEPDLLLLDEPTDGLDPVQIRDLRGLIRDLSAERGIVLSSHLLPVVQAVCTRTLILSQGRVLHEARLDTPATSVRYRLRLTQPLSPEALIAAAGLAAAEPLADATWAVTLHPDDAPDALARRLVAAGLGLAELTPERTDLERVFFAALAGEAAA